MVKRSSLWMSVFATLLVQNSNGFSSNVYSRRATQRTSTRVEMVSTASTGGNFFDDFNPQRRDGKDGQDASSSNNMNINRNQIQDGSTDKSSKFVAGDDLHRLRHQVLAMRLELQEARRNDDADRVRDLERAIMKTQQVDAEFVYTVSLERQQLAQQAGDLFGVARPRLALRGLRLPRRPLTAQLDVGARPSPRRRRAVRGAQPRPPGLPV